MRKDYIASAGTPADETDFVEDYWTKVWERISERAKRVDAVETTEEYQIMAPYLKASPADARMLDGGCGLGEFVVHLHRKGYRAVGVDLSRKTVDLLEKKHPGIAFEAGDIRQTAFETDSFDVYFSWGVFEHFEAGPGDCIAEGYRVLKPGGRLFITVPFDNLRQALRGAFERPAQSLSGRRFYQWRFTKAELARELALRGFEVEKLVPISKAEGVSRMLHHDFGLNRDWTATKALRRVLTPVVPSAWAAHMLMAVARKPVVG